MRSGGDALSADRWTPLSALCCKQGCVGVCASVWADSKGRVPSVLNDPCDFFVCGTCPLRDQVGGPELSPQDSSPPFPSGGPELSSSSHTRSGPQADRRPGELGFTITHLMCQPGRRGWGPRYCSSSAPQERAPGEISAGLPGSSWKI